MKISMWTPVLIRANLVTTHRNIVLFLCFFDNPLCRVITTHHVIFSSLALASPSPHGACWPQLFRTFLNSFASHHSICSAPQIIAWLEILAQSQNIGWFRHAPKNNARFRSTLYSRLRQLSGWYLCEHSSIPPFKANYLGNVTVWCDLGQLRFTSFTSPLPFTSSRLPIQNPFRGPAAFGTQLAYGFSFAFSLSESYKNSFHAIDHLLQGNIAFSFLLIFFLSPAHPVLFINSPNVVHINWGADYHLPTGTSLWLALATSSLSPKFYLAPYWLPQQCQPMQNPFNWRTCNYLKVQLHTSKL